MKRIATAITVVLVAASGQVARGQAASDVRKLYEAGQYQQVIAAVDPDPRVTFFRAQSFQKLSQTNDARQAYTQLAGRPESDAWHDIGRSALALMALDPAGALEAAMHAIALNGTLAEAHYQQGLALSARQDFAGAAAAFQKASDLDPAWAYPHYYAGLAYSKVKRVDLTAQHFQMFLRLAPQAPERVEVQSIMKTLNR